MGTMYKFSEPKRASDLKNSGDCMIRAVVHATGIPYRTVHKIMYGYGWRATEGRNVGKWTDHILKTLDDLGFAGEKISFPAEKGKKRIIGKTICKRYSRGTYILSLPGHVTCVRDGKLLDTWDCSGDFVYFMWRIHKVPIK